MNEKVTNPNDFKVVDFHNPTDFTFTPEMGCMYDGRPIFGITGAPGINAGESMKLPYHIGHQLALNLAKAVMVRKAPATDPAGIPTGVPLWDSVAIEKMKNSFLTDLYVEDKPIAVSETDRLMAKVEELKRFVEENVKPNEPAPLPAEPVKPVDPNEGNVPADLPPELPKTEDAKVVVFQDKQEVIVELEKRGIKHDKRKNKSELEKLLA